MKKSNNKRTKRLRMKYKKTKRNIKRRTLRKTRRSHRQRGGGLPSTTILQSTLSVGSIIFRNALTSLRQGAQKVGTETVKALDKNLTGKSVKPFTVGVHTAAEPVTSTRFLTELVEVMKNKIRAKGVKTILENCLFGEDKKAELSTESVRSMMYKKPNAASAVSSTLQRQTPIKINVAQFEQLKKDIGIDTFDTKDKEVTKAIDKFIDDIIKQETSQCKIRTPEKEKSAILSMVEEEE